MWAHVWGFLYSNYFRFWLKWLLRLLTGKCELQRLLGGAEAGARRTLSVGNGGAGAGPRGCLGSGGSHGIM